MAIQVMREVGVDLSGHHSKHLEGFQSQQFDYVVTLCGDVRDVCPVFSGMLVKFTLAFRIRPRQQEASKRYYKSFAGYAT